MRRLVALTSVAFLVVVPLAGAAASRHEVVVYGGTSAGVMAAVQAARMGRLVILVAPERHLGGMSASGHGRADGGDSSVIGGLAREFYRRVAQHYEGREAWKFETREEFEKRNGGRSFALPFEPHVAEAVFEAMLRESGVEVAREEFLDRTKGVAVKGKSLQAFTTRSGRTYRGQVFVDATYEGDLMAAAGVAYHVGREGNAVYKERWNGVQAETGRRADFFGTPIDPFIEPGNRGSGLLPGVSIEPPGLTGSEDRKIPAYSYRVCLTDVGENRLPFPRPDLYDAGRYQLILRLLASGWREAFDGFDRLPNGKVEARSHGPVSMDLVGESWSFPEAVDEDRRAIAREHERYQRGLLFFLSNDPRVPADVRMRMSRFGLARDEFTDRDHWPWQLDVREGRRLAGEYVMTEHDCLGSVVPPDPIGMSAAPLAAAHVQRYVTPQGYAQNEGAIEVATDKAYPIAYGAILPKRNECTNLLVPVAVSASHSAFGSIRVEPVLMVLGHSAGTAAALAVLNGVPVQGIDRASLRDRLVSDGQILTRP